ncbi:MAG: HAD family hydrolase, partial [Planctomycetaceae bacterium]
NTTGRDHPGADEVIAHHETNWRKVIDRLTGPVPNGRSIYYQKHMSHHLLPEIGRAWLGEVTNGFLIREPREVITSYVKKAGDPNLEDTGYPQLVEIFERVRENTGRTPPVLDAKDVLENPRRMLGLLCDALGVEFTDDMLSWPPGLRETDGVWAKHWYAEVEKSTSFRPYSPKLDPVPEHLRDLCDRCEEQYQRLFAERLR